MARWVIWLAAWQAPFVLQDRLPESEPPGAQPQPASLDGGRTVNPELLRPVRDNTLGLQPEDREAYFAMLWLAQTVGRARLVQFAREYREERRAQNPQYRRLPLEEFPAFVDLFMHPEAYRGRPVLLRGYFRRLVKFDPGKNDLGIEQAYEGWLYTLDSQTNPAVVVFTHKPPGLPLGGDITEEVQVVGYFLKMYGYEAQDTHRRAPLILAGEVQWTPAAKAPPSIVIPLWLYLLAPVLAGLMIWLIWRSQQPHTRLRRFPTTLNSSDRDFDAYPPQEFLPPVDDAERSYNRPVEPQH
ncbi:MAG: hypothetical protein KatS3mg113_0470 [Planctomycetaceae bacterium]|nr:MAG: hypothetical protein KatS3mg113_0470 [Planctomycetaceae bacterium]